MQCEEVHEHIADYLAGTLPREIEVSIAEHARGCRACGNELDDVGRLWAELGGIPAPQFNSSTARVAIENAVATLGLHADRPDISKWRIDMRMALKAAVVLVVVGGIAAATSGVLSREEGVEPPLAASPGIVPASAGAHTMGSPSAPITLVEFGDYECPPCVSYHSVIGEVMQRYPDMIKREYRHFPISAIHRNALPAAIAAEAAGEQGKFWEMHRLLLWSQSRWAHSSQPQEFFVNMARELDLDVERFQRSMASPEIEQRIQAQVAEARQVGIESVPALFINGKRHEFGDRPDIVRSIILSMIRTRLGAGTN